MLSFSMYKSNDNNSLVHDVWIPLSWNRDDAITLKVSYQALTNNYDFINTCLLSVIESERMYFHRGFV